MKILTPLHAQQNCLLYFRSEKIRTMFLVVDLCAETIRIEPDTSRGTRTNTATIKIFAVPLMSKRKSDEFLSEIAPLAEKLCSGVATLADIDQQCAALESDVTIYAADEVYRHDRDVIQLVSADTTDADIARIVDDELVFDDNEVILGSAEFLTARRDAMRVGAAS